MSSDGNNKKDKMEEYLEETLKNLKIKSPKRKARINRAIVGKIIGNESRDKVFMHEFAGLQEQNGLNF